MPMLRAYLSARDSSLARERMLSGIVVDAGAPIAALRWSLDALR
jgi:hypothetical protein